jgi:hypothetical protein
MISLLTTRSYVRVTELSRVEVCVTLFVFGVTRQIFAVIYIGIDVITVPILLGR